MAKSKLDQPASSATSKAKEKTKKTAFSISQEPVIGSPSEGDAHKYEAAPFQDAPPSGPIPAYEDLGALPASYNQDTLFLVARDPRWVFTYWDFDWSKFSASEHRYGVAQFFLKLRTGAGAEETTLEIKPEARNWYVPVGQPDTVYTAEIGYFDRNGSWQSIVKSAPAKTPPDALAEDANAQFATVPAHLAFERLLELVAQHMRDGETLLQAVARITGDGRQIAFQQGKAPNWTDEQRALLAALLGESLVDRVGLGSAEIDQLLRKQLMEKLQTESASELVSKFYEKLGQAESSLFSGIMAAGALFSGVTSWGASWSAQPFSVRRERGFYMHVNAEIIFYGGTHPDAKVTVGGKEITLNPDGTFRYHFTLPDGDFNIPIVAQSPDKVEARSATLSFARGTERAGEVGSTEQPKELAPLIGKK